MSYKILTFEQANNLLKDGLAKEVRSIDYNQCTVYKVLDGKLLVKPLHPFANSLLVQDENTLLEIENSNILPDGGEQESLYAQNKSLFEKGDFEKVKDSLLLNLQNYFNGLTSKYEINMLRCIFCGLCEEACPKDAIYLSETFTPSDFARQNLIYGKEDLLIPDPKTQPEDFAKARGERGDLKKK